MARSSLEEEPKPSTSTGHFNTIKPCEHQEEYVDFSSDDSLQDPNYQPLGNDDSSASSIGEQSVSYQIPPNKSQSVTSLYVLKKDKKLKRNTGLAYTTLKGKIIPGRKMKELTTCRMKCKERIPIFERTSVFEEYWNLGSYSKRSAFMASLIEIEEKGTVRIRVSNPDKQKFRTKTYKYFLTIDGKRQPICRGCLLKILDESDNFIKTVALKKRSSIAGIDTDDMRGRHIPKHKISDAKREEIKTHILSFPTYESHYSRKKTSKKYLPSHLTLQKMYELYKEAHENPTSIKIYSQEFHKLKLSFKKPHVDTCFTCDKFLMKIKLSQDEQIKTELISQHEDHKILADQAYDEKKLDTQLSKNDNTVQTYTFDLQQCLPTPSLRSSVAFYKRQLWTYNLTVHDNKTGKAVCYIWYETIAARGANQIASCLYKHLQTFLPPTTKHVIFYSDTCSGQNRNSHVSSMFTWALQHIAVDKIDHKFMIPGHSHLEVDTDHGIIEKKKKRTELQIYHPHDWSQLIKTSSRNFQIFEMKLTDFLDFSSLLKNSLVLRNKDTDGQQFKWLEKRWLRYEKEFGRILFKDTLDRELPFRTLNLVRKGACTPIPNIPVISSHPLPISKEKKDDLISILSLIPDIFHNFYLELPTAQNMRNTDPDIAEDEEEIEYQCS